jgi:hypothetical protein
MTRQKKVPVRLEAAAVLKTAMQRITRGQLWRSPSCDLWSSFECKTHRWCLRDRLGP